MKLVNYEKEVLKVLLDSVFSSSEIERIITDSTISSYKYTGAGYFLTLANDLFPVERLVISHPIITGKTDSFVVGFLLFLEKKQLLLECHSSGEDNPPKDIRCKTINLSIT